MAQQARGAEREALIAQLIRKEHPGMDVCRTNMMKLLDETRAIAGGSGGPLPWSKVLLSGFSLGSITALDVALYLGGVHTHTTTHAHTRARIHTRAHTHTHARTQARAFELIACG